MRQGCRSWIVTCLGMLWIAQLCPAECVEINRDWLFFKGSAATAEQIDFDDSQWRRLDIPHDWSIEDLSENPGPLDANAVSSYRTGYFVGGTAWYRKHFRLGPEHQGKRVHVHFDGVYMNADVWINGHHCGNHPYGYTAFWYDLTPHLRDGQDNVLAVEVKNEGANSRWYSGSGIYRSVHLKIMNPIHIDHWGPYITTPQVTEDAAQVRVVTEVVNESGQASDITLRTQVKGLDGTCGRALNESFKVKGAECFTQILTVAAPSLWSPDTPVLYQLEQEVVVDGEVVEQRQTPFGIREVTCDADKGFRLNGRPMVLQGLCMHHDNYMLGSAAYPRAEERRVEIAKAAGYNAIRCAHNPPSASFLEACDRHGMLVIDEAFDQWVVKKNKEDYHLYFKDWWQRDMESMVLRDRNHPSVVMWSIGNEIPEQRHEKGVELARKIIAHVKSLDDSRWVTIGANMAGEIGDRLFEHLDIVGYNYQRADYVSDHNRVPDRIMYASESAVKETFDYWDPVDRESHFIGNFVWAGFDYLGEASIGWAGPAQDWKTMGPYPWHLAYCGEMDACGFRRPASYYRDVLWKTGTHPVSAFVKSPVPSLPDYDPNRIHFWAHDDLQQSWTWPGYESQELEVVVYGVGDQVELFLNEQSLGRKPTSRETRYSATWNVPYTAGELKAVGTQNDQVIGQWILTTAGEPARLCVTVDRSVIQADGQDLAYVTVEVQDAHGIRIPQANNEIHFDIQGAGVLAGVGNGNPRGTESFQRSRRTAFQGRCVAVLKSKYQPGTISLNISSEGLPSETVKIQCLK